MNAEDPLFILYTSGSTGKPKGLLHTTGGYGVWIAATFHYVFDHQPDDIFWCSADIGWITGHSYVTYGPLLNGASQVIFEGVPNYPDHGRFWQVVEKHKVSIFYTAPTAIRALMREGDDFVTAHDRSSLRLLGTVGEPINPEAWRWYHRVVGEGRCPVVDTWWQTETGGVMLTTLPGAHAMKPGSAGLPFFGVQPQLVDAEGQVLEGAAEGNLCITSSWPGQARTIYGDHDRFVQTYFSTYKGKYFTSDVGPPHGHGRGRIGAGRPCQGRRGGGGGLSAPGQGTGHLLLCHAECGTGGVGRSGGGTSPAGPQGNRPCRHARPDPLHRRSAQDAQRQDHAPHPAQDRGERSWLSG